jgi:hypothetical protein
VSEEQLRLTFQEASSAVIYSEDPGTTKGHSQPVKSTTAQTACADPNTHGTLRWASGESRGSSGPRRAIVRRLVPRGLDGPVQDSTVSWATDAFLKCGCCWCVGYRRFALGSCSSSH